MSKPRSDVEKPLATGTEDPVAVADVVTEVEPEAAGPTPAAAVELFTSATVELGAKTDAVVPALETAELAVEAGKTFFSSLTG